MHCTYFCVAYILRFSPISVFISFYYATNVVLPSFRLATTLKICAVHIFLCRVRFALFTDKRIYIFLLCYKCSASKFLSYYNLKNMCTAHILRRAKLTLFTDKRICNFFTCYQYHLSKFKSYKSIKNMCSAHIFVDIFRILY